MAYLILTEWENDTYKHSQVKFMNSKEKEKIL